MSSRASLKIAARHMPDNPAPAIATRRGGVGSSITAKNQVIVSSPVRASVGFGLVRGYH